MGRPHAGEEQDTRPGLLPTVNQRSANMRGEVHAEGDTGSDSRHQRPQSTSYAYSPLQLTKQRAFLDSFKTRMIPISICARLITRS